MKKKLRGIIISIIILTVIVFGAYGVINIYFDKKTQENYVEKVLELTGSDDVNSVFLSIFPIDTIEDTAMRIGRLDVVAKVSDLAPDMDALVDALLTGPEAFTGSDPIDSYCCMWDTHM